MTTFQFYPKCFKLHTFYKKVIIPKYKHITFLDLYKGDSTKAKIIRRIKFMITDDLAEIFGNDKLEEGADLIYSTGCLYSGKEDWICDIYDTPYSLAGYKYNLFKEYLTDIVFTLSQNNCKKIIVRSHDSLTIMERFMPEEVMKKVELRLEGFK